MLRPQTKLGGRPQDGLNPLQASLEVALELCVFAPRSDVLVDRGSDHLDHGLVIDRGDGLERFRLVGRESDSHGFRCLHGYILAYRCYVVKNHGIVIPWLQRRL